MDNYNDKVLIIGLPKSGTSTLATMLRILDYNVTGPNPQIKELETLEKVFNNYDAFQDYPWCFEYPFILKKKGVRVVLLKRNEKAWAKSFKESYGGEDTSYLSYNYMKLSKNDSDATFHEYHKTYYLKALNLLKKHQINYIEVSLSDLKWEVLCGFLNKPIPRNIFGVNSKIPKVNTKNYLKKGKYFKLKKKIKRLMHKLLGNNYFVLTNFIYKNK